MDRFGDANQIISWKWIWLTTLCANLNKNQRDVARTSVTETLLEWHLAKVTLLPYPISVNLYYSIIFAVNVTANHFSVLFFYPTSHFDSWLGIGWRNKAGGASCQNAPSVRANFHGWRHLDKKLKASSSHLKDVDGSTSASYISW